MPRPSHSVGLAALAVVCAAFVLAGCGRKGPLDLPPTASVQPDGGQAGAGEAPAQQKSPAMEYGPDGKPLAPRGPKRKLPGDWLID